jgi:hypothetical protein
MDDDESHDCEMTCTTPHHCEDSPYEECDMTECTDECHEEEQCYSEWWDDNGEYHAGSCDDYWEMHDCHEEGLDQVADECDYRECNSKHGNDCWVEECNMMNECKPYTCTRWEFLEGQQYWTATDCADHGKDKDSSFFQTLFENAGKVLMHYDETA